VLHNTVRSLNLATAVGVVVYEALKRTGQMPMSQAPDQ
jgi:tRNA(Leu) C34 or U34 (ribose-2'-O)-methylase TrmL